MGRIDDESVIGIQDELEDQTLQYQIKKTLFVFLIVFLFYALYTGNVYATSEARCTELGSNCVCSEPFNTNSYATVGGGWYHNPGDTSTKECEHEETSSPITSLVTVVPRNDSTALNSLPSGHSVNYYLSWASGHTGTNMIGQRFSGIPNDKRIAIRWYQYYSSGYEFKDEVLTSCVNSKFFDFDPRPHGDYNGDEGYGSGSMVFYDFSGGWSPDGGGVGIYSRTIDFDNELNGKWYRYELVFINNDGVSSSLDSYIIVYMKNITDDTAEETILDSRTDYTGEAPSMTTFQVNQYRQGTCGGYAGMSHMLVASWATDTGQRIGAAEEIEGGEVDTTSPIVTAFTIPSTSTELTVPISTFTATDVVGVTGYCVNESATPPTSGTCAGSDWAGSAQTEFTFTTSGAKTLYAWAKDAAGNISDSLNDSVTINIGITEFVNIGGSNFAISN